VICWEDYRDIFRVEGFLYKDQIEELLIVMVYCIIIYSFINNIVFPTRNIVNFLINFTFFNCNILIKNTI